MPTRLSLGEYEAWITVEDKEIEHFSIEVDTEKKEVTCWIASQEGKNFAICALKKHKRFICAMEPHLDGTRSRKKAIDKQTVTPVITDAVGAGDRTMRMLKFSRLDVTDDDALLNDPSARDIGDIKINIYRVEFTRHSSVASNKVNHYGIPANQKVHERSKKAMAHRVGFGEPLPDERRLLRCRVLELKASFIFRYRSLDILRANGIASHPSTLREKPQVAPIRHVADLGKRKASEVKEEESDEELDSDELDARRKEEEEIAQLVAEKMKARNARKANQPPRKKVKQESLADARPVFLPGEIIDLT